MARLLLLASCCFLAGCGNYPADMTGTLERVEARHAIRLAVCGVPDRGGEAMVRFLRRLEQATGATVRAACPGSTEAMFAALEKGTVDLVIDEVAEDSPWLTEVTVVEPIATRRVGERVLGLSPVARNGENRWIALIEKQVRDMKAGA